MIYSQVYGWPNDKKDNNEMAMKFFNTLKIRLGCNVYWQVIETNWTSAPVLRRPTKKVRLGGRKFNLYTTGGNIHMVVLRENGASYWVVNTLRDELSNETMLAIAKGLQPLGK